MPIAKPAEPLDQPKRPFYGLNPLSWAIYRSSWWVVWCIDRVLFRTRTQGLDKVDKDGPMLLLSNHVGLLDPFWVALHIYRPSRFMAATSVLKIPFIGPYLGMLGAFPKMKYVKDRDSMELLATHYENGQAVTLFPEGVRSWTGEQRPIGDGIGRLIKRLNARVLFGRIHSGYLAIPRWAKYPRWVPIDIDYIGPVQYPDHLTVAEITEDVRKKLLVKPRRDKSKYAFGFRLAAGLPTLLWACPHCFAVDGLAVMRRNRNKVGCKTCKHHWRVDIDTMMHGDGETATMTVAQAYRAITDHFGTPPILERDRYQNDGVVAEHSHARLRHMPHRGKPRLVAEGNLWIDQDGVHLHGDGDPWQAQFANILSVSTEVAGQVFLRTAGDTAKGEVYRLEVPNQSSYKWGLLLQSWLKHHRDGG